jgi:quercetin dioxygenase-like cupin family protein
MNEVNDSENMIDTASQGYIFGKNIEWEYIQEGIRRKILGFDDNLMMTLMEFKKNSKGSVHTHPNRQITFIVYGSFEIQIESEKKLLNKGDSFFIPPSVQHGVTALEDALLVEVFSPSREDFIKK